MKSDLLIGDQLEKDGEIQSSVNSIVQRAMALTKEISGIRAPLSASEKKNVDAMAQMNAARGRPLYYPYISTGAGNGPFVELQDGSVKLDLINGIGVHVLGHNHPEVLKASLTASLADVVMQGNLQPGREYGRIAHKLVELAKRQSRLRHVWVSTCGSVANENALKVARQKKTPARKIIAMRGAFAGRTTLMAEITDNPAFRVGLPEYNEVLRIPFYDKNDPRSTEKSLQEMKKHVSENPGNISCFIFEPMQGEGGYFVAPREFFLPILDFCRDQKIPIWDDEVQTFCRTGEFFAYETLNLGEYIDICTVAKTAQVGATLYTEEFNPQPGLLSGTFTGGSTSLAAGNAILEFLDGNSFMGSSGKVQKLHKEFVNMLKSLSEGSCKGLLNDIEGLGLMIGVTPLDGSKEKQGQILHALFKNGLISFGCGRGPYRIRFLLPVCLESGHIEIARKILEKTLLELA